MTNTNNKDAQNSGALNNSNNSALNKGNGALQGLQMSGKTAVVTGGLGLIGKQICLALAKAGAKVLVLDINQEGKFEKECKNLTFVKFDATDLKGASACIERIFSEYGSIHAWINSSYPRTKDWGAKLEEVNPESWQKNVDMQMNSYCLISRDVAEQMKKRGIAGSIINIASIYGLVAPDFSIYDGTQMTMPAAYSAIKAGIINFSRYLASYYGRDSIRVNSVCAGGILNGQDANFVRAYEQKTMLGRMGKPEDIAGAVVFLASDASAYITGIALPVDGGWTAL